MDSQHKRWPKRTEWSEGNIHPNSTRTQKRTTGRTHHHATFLIICIYIYIYIKKNIRNLLLTWFVCPCVRLPVCLFVKKYVLDRSSLHLVRFGQLLRCTDTCIVNIMKVCINMYNTLVGLIRFRKKRYSLYSCLLLRSEEFNAISLTERNSREWLSPITWQTAHYTNTIDNCLAMLRQQ